MTYSRNMDLFIPIVEQNKLHHNFVMTAAPHALVVRKVISDWVNGFIDRDGKFIKEFKTTYDSSFWELYLFAVLSTRHDLALIKKPPSGSSPAWRKIFIVRVP